MNKKFRFLAILMVLLAACLFTACDGGALEELWKDELGNGSGSDGDGPTTVAVESVSLDKAELTLKTGTDGTLTATVLPENATDKSVIWSSDNEAVATVDQNGKVAGISSGTAEITVTTTDGAKTATCEVTVTDKVYTVIFDVQGHGTAPKNQYVKLGEKVTEPDPAPTATGYTFGGWYKDTGCTDTEAWDFASDTINEEKTITLYAKWTANKYTIIYKDENADFPESQHEEGYPTMHTYGTATTLKTASGVLGYTFDGWYETSDCSGTAVTSLGETAYTDNITLYAKQTPIADPLSGKFSVSATKQVNFSKGNLYWDGSKFQFEEKQYDYRHYRGKENDMAVINGTKIDTPVGTVGSFFWTKDAEKAYAGTYDSTAARDEDTFFAAESKKWRTLSKDEWNYLLGIGDGYKRTVNGDTGEGKCYQRATINSDATSVYGMILYPDNYTGTAKTSYTSDEWVSLETAGCVFLPGAGYRTDSSVSNMGSTGRYWAATPYGSIYYAYRLNFDSNSSAANTNSNGRGIGCSVRLVCDVSEN